MTTTTGEPSGSPVVRPALPADAPLLAALRYAFRAGMLPPTEEEAAFLARAVPWMAGRLAPGTAWRAWVAEAGGAPVGCLWLQLIEKIPNPGTEREHHGYITSVFVRPSARGRGIAARMVETAITACREAGVDAVILWPTARSRPLYERAGFSPPGDMLTRVLDG